MGLTIDLLLTPLKSLIVVFSSNDHIMHWFLHYCFLILLPLFHLAKLSDHVNQVKFMILSINLEFPRFINGSGVKDQS